MRTYPPAGGVSTAGPHSPAPYPGAHGTLPIPRRALFRAGLAVAVAGGVQVFSDSTATAVETTTLVKDGTAQSILVFPDAADPQRRRDGALLIQDYLKKAADMAKPVPAARASLVHPSPGRVTVWIDNHPNGEDEVLRRALDPAKRDGFAISVRADEVIIAGLTPWAARFGCEQFCEQFLGVQWLMPTYRGEDVPKARTVSLPRGTWYSNPQMISRVLFPLKGNRVDKYPLSPKPALLWAQRHRTHFTIKQNHGLGPLLDKQEYRENYPSIWPIIDGQRYTPPAGRYTRWQPRFTSPELVNLLVDGVIAHFDAFPEDDQLQLSVNDGSSYSEDELATTGYNSMGLHDMSDLYFRTINQVVAEVNRRRPDLAHKSYGVLAYQEVYDPPSFDVSDQVVVFVCRERTWRSSAEFRQADDAHLRSWAERARNWGLYGYCYGARYAIPRLHQKLTGDLYRFAGSHGAMVAFDEWQTTWAEGPKPQTLLRLMWDPTYDVETGDTRWYAGMAGPGADDLRSYFAVWDEIWSQRMAATDWFRGCSQLTFGRFDNPGYLEAVSLADVSRSTAALSRARAAAVTPEQSWRLSVVTAHQAYTEATVRSYPRHEPAPTNAGTALQLIDTTIGALPEALAAAQARPGLFDAIVSTSPGVDIANAPHRRGLQWSGWNYHSAWTVATYLRRRRPGYRAVQQRLLRIRRTHAEETARTWADTTLKLAEGEVVNLATNGDFADGMTDWTFAHNCSPDEAPRVTTDCCDDGQALRLTGPFATGALTHDPVPVTEGFFRHSTWLYVRRHDTARGAVGIGWALLDAAGGTMDARTSSLRPLDSLQSGWTQISHSDHLPSGTASVKINISLFVMGMGTPLYVARNEFLQLAPGAHYTYLEAPAEHG